MSRLCARVVWELLTTVLIALIACSLYSTLCSPRSLGARFINSCSREPCLFVSGSLRAS